MLNAKRHFVTLAFLTALVAGVAANLAQEPVSSERTSAVFMKPAKPSEITLRQFDARWGAGGLVELASR
jgi:hypothetical protein